MTISKLVDVILAFLSIGSAIVMAIAKYSVGEQWQLTLLAVSVLSLATMLTKQQFQWKDYQQRIEGTLTSLLSEQSGSSLDQKVVNRLLQSFMFTGSSIDGKFWVRYGGFLLDKTQNPKHIGDVLRELLEIRSTSRISSQEKKYDVMRMLFEAVEEYRGVVFYEELRNDADDSQEFIFLAPMQYGHAKRIERLFILTNLQDLKQLPDDKRKKLKEQLGTPGVSLAYCEKKKDKWPANFGIYGPVAVGTLKDKVNDINFDTRAVLKAREEWNSLWKESKPLKEEHL
jgi:hypothetical protein